MANIPTAPFAVSDDDQSVSDFSTWIRHIVQQDEFDQPDDGILFKIIRRAVDELGQRTPIDSHRTGSEERKLADDMAVHIGEVNRQSDVAHVLKQTKALINDGVAELTSDTNEVSSSNGGVGVNASDHEDGSSDIEESPSNDESDTDDDDDPEQGPIALFDAPDDETQHDSGAYTVGRKIPRIEDDLENTFAVRELFPDDDRTLLARPKPYFNKSGRRMKLYENTDESEILQLIDKVGTLHRDKRPKLPAPSSIEERKLGLLIQWPSVAVTNDACGTDLTLKGRCQVSFAHTTNSGTHAP
jgi:hypothetical protein